MVLLVHVQKFLVITHVMTFELWHAQIFHANMISEEKSPVSEASG